MLVYILLFCPLILIARTAEVLSLGGACVDLLIHVPDTFLNEHSIEKGGSLQIDKDTFYKLKNDAADYRVEIHPGGSSSNTIRGLAKLNHKVAFLAKVGQDEIGWVFTQSLLKNHVDAHILPSEKPTMQVMCFITPDGERTMRCLPGAANDLHEADLTEELFKGIKHLHLEGYSLYDVGMVERAMKLGKEEGATISLDLSSFEIVRKHRDTLLRLIEKYVDIVFCNELEAQELIHEKPEIAAKKISSLRNIACVPVGENGVWVAKKGIVEHVPTIPKVIVDATGAGDLFAAGFLHGYLKGVPLNIAASWGHLTGGAVIEVIGAEIPDETWDRINEVMQGSHQVE